MISSNTFDPSLCRPLLDDLATPLHRERLRDQRARADARKEVDLSGGYALQTSGMPATAGLRTCMKDFHAFMQHAMDVKSLQGRYRIVISAGAPEGCPLDAPEAYHIAVDESECRITAGDEEGIRRALIFLEDEMSARRGPYLSIGAWSRWAVVRDRIVCSPCMPYRFASGWPLQGDLDAYPDEYLNKLAHCGINGIWIPGLLRDLVASQVIPELRPRAGQLGRLKRLVSRAARYGIKVFLFCIEPRALPHDHPAFTAHPEIRGARLCEVTTALCTSSSKVRRYIRDVMRQLFTEVPRLAGIINIFNGERGTTCWLEPQYVTDCPRCRKRNQADVLAEDLNAFMAGIRDASSTARLLAWTYSMDAGDNSMTALPAEPVLEVIRRASPEITWLTNFEHGGSKRVDSVDIKVQEYSLSYTGPSPTFAQIAEGVRQASSENYAKLQIGTSHELSSVPYLPVPGIVYDKLMAMRQHGVTGAMMNWMLGGYPSVMLKAAGEASFEPMPDRPAFLNRLAAICYGDRAAKKGSAAWDRFARTFADFPNTNQLLYFGPLIRSPAYHLQLRPESRLARLYNWGWDHRRRQQPFEDKVARWLGPFTAPQLYKLLRKLGHSWNRGLASLARTQPDDRSRATHARKGHAVAAAVGIQLLSAANVIEFYTLRDRLMARKVRQSTATLLRMLALVEDDIALAQQMKIHVKSHPAIGFHSEMLLYSYSADLLDEKIEHARKTATELKRLTKSGQLPNWDSHLAESAGATDIAEVPPIYTYRTWLQHGD